MTNTAQPPSATQGNRLALVLTGIALVAAVAYLAVVLINPKSPGLKPALVTLTTVPSTGTPKVLGPNDEVSADEKLDMSVTITKQAYVYVFLVEQGQPFVLSQPQGPADLWEPGTFAPDWDATLFTGAGEATLVVLSAPQLIADAPLWSAQELSHPTKKCPECAVFSLPLKVTASRAAPDAGLANSAKP